MTLGEGGVKLAMGGLPTRIALPDKSLGAELEDPFAKTSDAKTANPLRSKQPGPVHTEYKQ